MTFTREKLNTDQALTTFNSLDVDNKLAFLWFVYTKMGDSITPAAPGAAAASEDIAEGLYQQVKELSHEEQLQVQRDLLSKSSQKFQSEYDALKENTQLLFWYRLAQGMEKKEIIPMPDNYELSEDAKSLLDSVEAADFEEQITFLRSAVTS